MTDPLYDDELLIDVSLVRALPAQQGHLLDRDRHHGCYRYTASFGGGTTPRHATDRASRALFL